MIKHEHGEYQLILEGQILKVKCLGSWNIELVKRMAKEFKEVATSISDKPWACMVDLLDWQLGVPEMWEEIYLINKWSCKNNQKFEVVVTNNTLMKSLLEKSHTAFTGVDTVVFYNQGYAKRWLQSKGLLTSQMARTNFLFDKLE